MSSVDEARLASLLRLATDDAERRRVVTGTVPGVTPDEVTSYALAKPGAWPDSPWDDDQVAKVGPGERGKIFAFLGRDAIGVKCGAGRDGPADDWLDRYPDDAAVMAYIGRGGWNTLRLDGAIPDDELLEAVDRSYEMVVAKLPRRDRPQEEGA